MNRNLIKIALLTLVFTVMGSQAQAQFTTTFAKNVNPGQHSGFYYSLPQTMLQLDFVIEETECIPGPLAGYASSYFGDVESVDYATTKYELLDIKMTTTASPDPDATFFVSMTSGRGGTRAEFDILPNGIIRSVGVGTALEEQSEQKLSDIEPQPQFCEKQVENHGFVNLLVSGKTDAQLAREAADKIAEIRKEKLFLSSGDGATASHPETFRAMYQKLDDMEKEYTSLFLGVRNVKTVVRSVYVIPSKEVTTQTVAKFSETEGLSVGTSGAGSAIMVQTLPLNTTGGINAPSQSAVESMSYENKLFYRVPETAKVKVTYKNRTLLEERLPVNQLGVLLMVPFTNTKMEFDTSTGQVVNFKMK